MLKIDDLISHQSGPHTLLHRVVRKVQGLLPAHQQCVVSACISVLWATRRAGSVSRRISRGTSESSGQSCKPAGAVRYGR